MLKTIFQASRPNFLVLTPICVLLGIASASLAGNSLNYWLAVWIALGALLAHISVNLLNEYSDFKSGLDLITERTAFSGGSGALVTTPDALKGVLVAGIITLALTIVLGCYFVMLRGVELLPIGLIGISIVVAYTQWINRLPWLCLIAPGIGFGILMVVGTHFVLTAEYSLQALTLSFIPFFLVNNLLLLNQYPDIAADKSIGRKHFPITYGIENSNRAYLCMLIGGYGLIAGLVLFQQLPLISLMAMLPIGLSLLAYRGMCIQKQNISQTPQYLAANVASALLTPLILAISLLV